MRKVFQALCQILSGILGVSPDLIAPDAFLSSLKYQELASAAIACEKTFHIEMEDERIKELCTPEQWADYILKRIADRDNAAPAPTEKDRESWYY